MYTNIKIHDIGRGIYDLKTAKIKTFGRNSIAGEIKSETGFVQCLQTHVTIAQTYNVWLQKYDFPYIRNIRHICTYKVFKRYYYNVRLARTAFW